MCFVAYYQARPLTVAQDSESEEEESEDEEDKDEESDDAMGEDEDYDDEEEWQGISTNDALPSAPTDTPALPAPTETAESSAPATRYVPPHLRNKAAAGNGQDAEVIAKLTKKLKGLLNRCVSTLPCSPPLIPSRSPHSSA